METEKYQDQFQRACFKPALEELLRQTGENLGRDTERIIPQVIKPVARLMDRTWKLLSEDGQTGRPVWISLSFLRISLRHGKPVLLAETYHEMPFLMPPLLSWEIPAEWMFPAFRDYQEDIARRVQEEVLGHRIRKPELRSHESEAVSAILRYLFFYMKYAVRNIEEEEVWELFGKETDLTISFGEYMDWQLPIAAARPEIDLFLCDRGTDLTFRRFKGLHYEGNDFADWILDDCVFEQCTFRKMSFKGTKFRNTRFMGCTFEACRFEGVSLMGASVLNCLFGRTEFAGCSFAEGWQKEDGKTLYYAMGSFRRCIMDGVQWENTETADNMFTDCRIL